VGILVGLDHGGSTTTALAVGDDGRVVGRHSVSISRRSPHAGWIEHDPDDFIRTSLAAAGGALAVAGGTWRDVDGVGVANQGETTIAWDHATGRPVGPALSWQDRRTTATCERLVAAGHDMLVRERTGLPIDPYFSATKIRWLLDNCEDARTAARRGSLRVGGTDAFLFARLTGAAVHATDLSTASRTGLLNLAAGAWDADVAEGVFDIPLELLPEIRPTIGDFGRTRHAEIPAEVGLFADVVDANAALFAHGCRGPDVPKATFGTGAFIAVNLGDDVLRPDDGLLPFIAWQVEGSTSYTLEGGVFDVGAAVDWLAQLGVIATSRASGELAAGVSDTRGVVVVPSFSGLAAPRWDSRARGAVLGLGLDAGAPHVARALLEGIACSVAEIVLEMERLTGVAAAELRADGGPTRNGFLMQCQADMLGRPVSVSRERELTAFGAALMAGLGAGALTASDVARLQPRRQTYEPSAAPGRREAAWRRWRTAVDAVATYARAAAP
jgi:glycerol kinase